MPPMPTPCGRQSLDKADVAAVDAVLRSVWLTQGPAVTRFETEFAAACDAPYAVAFSSGTAALHSAAFAAGLGESDELVTSAITFAAPREVRRVRGRHRAVRRHRARDVERERARSARC